MPQTVRVPGLGDIQFPDNMSQDEIKGVLDQQVPELLKQRQNIRPDYTTGELVSKALTRGTKQLGVAFGDVVPAMIAKGLGFEEEAKRQMEEARATQEEIQAQYAPEYQSYKDVTGPLSALGYVTESALEQVPNLATALIPGGIGAQVGRRLGLAAGERALVSEFAPAAGKKLTSAEAVRLAQEKLGPEAVAQMGLEYGGVGAGRGINTGIFLGSYAQNAPEVFQNIYDTTGQMEPGAALLAGAAAASLDSVLPGYLVKKFTGPNKALFVERLLEKSGMEPSLARKAIATLPEAAGLEGLTEGTQEAISIAAEKYISKNPDKFTSDEWNRILESGVKGAAAGLFFGIPGAVGSRIQERRAAAPLEPTVEEITPTAEVTPPTPTEVADVTGLQGGPYGGMDTTGLGADIPVSGQPTDVGLPGTAQERVESGYSVPTGVAGRPEGGVQEQPAALVTEPAPAPEVTEEVTPAPSNLTPEAQTILQAAREGTINEDMLMALPRVTQDNGIPVTRDKKTGMPDDKIMLAALQDKERAYQAAQVQEARMESFTPYETVLGVQGIGVQDIDLKKFEVRPEGNRTIQEIPAGTRLFHGAHGVRADEINASKNVLNARAPYKSGGGTTDEGGLIWFGDKDLAQGHANSEVDAYKAAWEEEETGIKRRPGQVFSTVTTEPLKLINRNRKLTQEEADKLNEAFGFPPYKQLEAGDSADTAAFRAVEYRPANVQRYKINNDIMTAAWPVIFKALGVDGLYHSSGIAIGVDKVATSPLQNMQEARTEIQPSGETKESITEHLKGEFGNNILTAQKRGNLQIANTIDELPEEVRSKMAPNAVGAFHKGTSYLVADRMDKPTARRTLLHEVGEHHGLEGMLGKDVYKQVLRSLKSNKELNKDIAQAWDEVSRLYPELSQNDEQFLREVLAKVGENAPENTIWRRVVGAVKNFLTKMGLYNPNKFTTADIQDLILHSLRKTLKQPMPTPSRETQFAKMGPTNTADPKVAAQLLQSVGDAVKNIPAYNSDIGVGARAALSKVSPTARKIAMSFLSLPNKIDLYGDRLPQLKELLSALEQRASKADTLRARVDINTHKYLDILKKYPDHVVKKWTKLVYQLSNESDGVYPAQKIKHLDKEGKVYYTDNINYDPNNPLVRNYEQMPKDLQQLGLDIHAEYEKMGNDTLDNIEKLIGPGTKAALALRKRFEKNRLKFYHPLRRKGQYWASYKDKNGEIGVIARASPAERTLAIKQLQAQNATDFHEFTRLDTADYKQAPPVGFIADVIKQLDKQLDAAGTNPEVAEGIKNQVYQTYLDLLPAESLRQQFRGREGIPGYIEDVVGGYADTASKMANQLTNLEYRPKIDGALSDMRTALENYRKEGAEDIEALTDVVQDMYNQKEFLDNPVVRGPAATASWVSYFWNIAGNVSSALVNLTQLAMVVYPMLAGRFGWSKATSMMMDAAATYMKGGLDSNRKFMPDWTFGAKLVDLSKLTEEEINKLPSDVRELSKKYFKLYDQAIKHSTMRRGVGYELTELRNRTADQFTGRKAKVETALSWIFQNSERANREITMLAAYDLALADIAANNPNMSKEQVEQKAIEYALDLTVRAHSHTLSEAGPKMFQTGFGKVAFTFKRFAQAQMANMIRLAAIAFKGLDPAEQKVARKQLLGILGMTYVFSGVQGLPLYGGATMFASALAALFGGDDEPFDPDEEVRNAIGMLGYKGPINLLTNIDIASRTGFNGMIWRDDPRRLAEVGFAPYFAEHFFGPAYQALLVNPTRAAELWNQGHVERALETVSPTFIRSPMKAFRFATEGALTTNGAKIVDDVNAYSSFMQIFGFSNAELTEAYTRASAMKEAEKYIQNRRTALLDLAFLSKSTGDMDTYNEVREKIVGFNESHPAYRISQDTLSRSYRGHMQRIKDSVYGVNLNKKLKAELMAREEED